MKNIALFFVIVVCLVCFVYWDVFHLGFAYVDDQWMLLDEKLIQSKAFNGSFISNVFMRINSLQYSPLNTLYYYFIFQINGYDPFWYHTCSLIIHILNVVLVYILGKKLFQLYYFKDAGIVVYAVTLLWAILPLNVEAVVWVSASKILLYTFWGLISFIYFVEAYIKSNKYFYIVSLLSFTLAFLAKEQSVLFALMLILFVYTYEKVNLKKVSFKKLFIYTSPYIVLAFVFGLVTLYAAVYGEGSHYVDRYPFSQRIVLAFYCLCFYAFNSFIPVGLHYHYPFPIKLGQTLPFNYYLYPLIVIAILLQAINLTKKSKYYGFYIFCFGTFIVHLLLCIQVFPLARAAMLADRYMYIPSIGLLFLFAGILTSNFHFKFQKITVKNTLVILGFIIYVVVIALYSRNLVNNWKDMQIPIY